MTQTLTRGHAVQWASNVRTPEGLQTHVVTDSTLVSYRDYTINGHLVLRVCRRNGVETYRRADVALLPTLADITRRGNPHPHPDSPCLIHH